MDMETTLDRATRLLLLRPEFRRMDGGTKLHAVIPSTQIALCGARPRESSAWQDALGEVEVRAIRAQPDCKRCAERMPPAEEEGRPSNWGYIRTSTGAQSLGRDAQWSALTRYNIPLGAHMVAHDHIVQEVASGAAGTARPVLDAITARLKKGDILVVARLDRLGRSVRELAAFVEFASTRGVRLISVLDQVDTGSAHGRLLTHVLAAAAEYELELLRDRTRWAMRAARERGIHCGRPWSLGEVEVRAIRAQHAEGVTVAELARAYHVSESTVRRRLAEPR